MRSVVMLSNPDRGGPIHAVLPWRLVHRTKVFEAAIIESRGASLLEQMADTEAWQPCVTTLPSGQVSMRSRRRITYWTRTLAFSCGCGVSFWESEAETEPVWLIEFDLSPLARFHTETRDKCVDLILVLELRASLEEPQTQGITRKPTHGMLLQTMIKSHVAASKRCTTLLNLFFVFLHIHVFGFEERGPDDQDYERKRLGRSIFLMAHLFSDFWAKSVVCTMLLENWNRKKVGR